MYNAISEYISTGGESLIKSFSPAAEKGRCAQCEGSRAGGTHVCRKFKCAECSKTFKRHQELRRHMLIHTGIRPFVCSDQNCRKSFARKDYFTRHLQIHTRKGTKQRSKQANVWLFCHSPPPATSAPPPPPPHLPAYSLSLQVIIRLLNVGCHCINFCCIKLLHQNILINR